MLHSEEIALQLQQDEMTLHQTQYQHQPQVINHITMTTAQTQHCEQSRGREQSNVSEIIIALLPTCCLFAV